MEFPCKFNLNKRKMPYKTEKLKMPRHLDARVKLTEEDKQDIKETREGTGLSYQKIADMFDISKRMVMFICNPEMEKKCKEQYKARRVDGRYYLKEKHAKAMRKHRNRKYELLKDKIK